MRNTISLFWYRIWRGYENIWKYMKNKKNSESKFAIFTQMHGKKGAPLLLETGKQKKSMHSSLGIRLELRSRSFRGLDIKALARRRANFEALHVCMCMSVGITRSPHLLYNNISAFVVVVKCAEKLMKTYEVRAVSSRGPGALWRLAARSFLATLRKTNRFFSFSKCCSLHKIGSNFSILYTVKYIRQTFFFPILFSSVEFRTVYSILKSEFTLDVFSFFFSLSITNNTPLRLQEVGKSTGNTWQLSGRTHWIWI